MANVKISELNSLSKKAYNDIVPIVDVSANETKKVSIEELVNNNVSLIAVTDTAPSECEEGDMYYNTTDNLIYTATAEDTWGETGETPKNGIMYIVYSKKSTYAYDGETLISVGGGSGAYIGTTEPPQDDNSNVWINPNESVNVYGNYISNSYGTSQEIGYSQEYVNNANSYSTSEVMTNKRWIDGKPIYRKIIEFGALPNATAKSVAHSISNLSNVIYVKGWAKRTDGVTFPIPYVSGNNLVEDVAIYTNNTNVTIYCGTDRTEFANTYITLEYTKTN